MDFVKRSEGVAKPGKKLTAPVYRDGEEVGEVTVTLRPQIQWYEVLGVQEIVGRETGSRGEKFLQLAEILVELGSWDLTTPAIPGVEGLGKEGEAGYRPRVEMTPAGPLPFTVQALNELGEQSPSTVLKLIMDFVAYVPELLSSFQQGAVPSGSKSGKANIPGARKPRTGKHAKGRQGH